jgi:type IV pilus assembly protein PilC
MKKFNFKAKNWKGKKIDGVVEARSRKAAVKLLKERELVVINISEKEETIFDKVQKLFLMHVSLGQIVTFTRQLSTMIEAGLPLTDALTLLEKQAQGKMQNIIEESLAEVQSGEPFAKALKKHEKTFGKAYVASVAAGEEGGVLDKVFQRLADNLEKRKEFVGKVKGAMIYPIIVVVGMVLVTFIMMIFVIPKMTALYSEFDAEMPLPTQILMGIANFMANYFYIFPILGVIGYFLFRAYINTPEGRMKIDELKLKVPIIGPLIENTILTQLSRTLGTLLGTGVPMVEALEIVSEATGNEVYAEGLRYAADRVEKGFPLSESLEENPHFPLIVSQMVSTGEETGKIDVVMQDVAHYFSVQAEEKVKTLTSAIEPLIMIVLGVGVGFLVIAIILPIYNLTSQF